MLFSSVEFIFFFLPLSLLLYFLAPKRLKNLMLFVESLVFYAWGEPVYLFLMLCTVALCFFFGTRIEKHPQKSRLFLGIAVGASLSLLVFFKYLPPALSVFGVNFPIALPVGISFYTFQALSYVIDVYRGERAQKSFVDFGAYITMFPQLVAGPIVRYESIADALNERRHSFEKASSGIERFVVGLCKKLIFANSAGEMWSYFQGLPRDEISSLGAWLGIVFFAFQIYFDFSGYSDMAIGLGRIFGFEFPENFNYPYTSKSIKDFWGRWHISLSDWFREYLYIPLGGNRKGGGRTVLNMLAVWVFTGLWHGSSLNFLLWGLYYFSLLTFERLFLSKILKKLPAAMTHAYSLFFILIGWVLFASSGLGDAISYLSRMFSFTKPYGFEIYHLLRNIPFLLLLALGSTQVPRQAYERLCRGSLRPILSLGGIAAFIICIADLVGSSYNPFLYFRF